MLIASARFDLLVDFILSPINHKLFLQFNGRLDHRRLLGWADLGDRARPDSYDREIEEEIFLTSHLFFFFFRFDFTK